MGSDRAGAAPQRLEWSNELTAGASWSRASVEVALPFLARRVAETSEVGLGDLWARGALEVLRHEEPEASDALRVGLQLGLPTSRGASRWLYALGTSSVTPGVAVAWRHSDQSWALTGSLYAGLPVALPAAAVVFGPWFGSSLGAEYEAFRWLTARLSVDVKQQFAARERGVVLPESQFFAAFLAPEARFRPARWFSASLGASVPVVSASPGAYVHGFVYRLGVELAI
ncbi:MAG: hypothetical protein IPJ65_35230 [Archangiaceae bacterium]|nr:hypothetical protein [Archangiaceae bacterium]